MLKHHAQKPVDFSHLRLQRTPVNTSATARTFDAVHLMTIKEALRTAGTRASRVALATLNGPDPLGPWRHLRG